MTTCDECPWLKKNAPGLFPPANYRRLLNTVGDEDALRPIFACHKSAEGDEQPCVGYLLVEGWKNLFVRLAAIYGRFDPTTLKATGELWSNWREMFAFHGVDFDSLSLEEKASLEEACRLEVEEAMKG